MRKLFILILCLGCFYPVKARQTQSSSLEARVNELTQTVKELKAVVEAQQNEINQLRQAKETPPTPLRHKLFLRHPNLQEDLLLKLGL
jgi:small-conductance mechanosensitive channel